MLVRAAEDIAVLSLPSCPAQELVAAVRGGCAAPVWAPPALSWVSEVLGRLAAPGARWHELWVRAQPHICQRDGEKRSLICKFVL